MTKIKNVNLEFNCTEQKDTFSKSEKGFLCTKCSNQVIDFTKKSSDELQREINKSIGPVCGIFNRAQLSEKFIKYAAATFIVTSSLTLSASGQGKIEAESALKTGEHLTEQDDDIFFGSIIEIQAEPIGGYEKFFEALSKEIKYPKGLATKGKSFIEFTVDTAGRMSNIRIVKGLNEVADQEAVRALKALNYPFAPGRQRNKPINTRLIIPIIVGSIVYDLVKPGDEIALPESLH